MYVCFFCGKEVDLEKVGRIRCPHCGGKILLKRRPNVKKKVKAR